MILGLVAGCGVREVPDADVAPTWEEACILWQETVIDFVQAVAYDVSQGKPVPSWLDNKSGYIRTQDAPLYYSTELPVYDLIHGQLQAPASRAALLYYGETPVALLRAYTENGQFHDSWQSFWIPPDAADVEVALVYTADALWLCGREEAWKLTHLHHMEESYWHLESLWEEGIYEETFAEVQMNRMEKALPVFSDVES